MAASRPNRPNGKIAFPESGTEQNDTRRLQFLVCLVWAGLLLFHATKALKFFPLIIPDEYTYVSDIRHRAFSDALVPNYLYSALYSLTSLFGDSFFDAGRILNAVVFMLSAPFVYATAKSACGNRNHALALAFICAISPLSSYTAFFMPESLYFTAFWAMTWLLIGRDTPMTPRNAGLAGIGVGLLALIKPHGLFLMPGLLLFLLVRTYGEDRDGFLRRTAAPLAAAVAGFLLARCGLGALFAGVAGLHPLGTAYAQLGEEGRQSVVLLSFIPKVLYNMLGNIVGIGAIAGIPILATVLRLAPPPATERESRLRRMTAYAVCFLVPLFCVSAAFCGMLDEHYPDETIREITRIQWRFYNFIFPMFLIVAAGILPEPGQELALGRRGRWLFLIPATQVAYVGATDFFGYHPSTLPDCPELGSMLFFPSVRILYSLACCALCLGFIRAPAKSLRVYLFVLVPVFSAVGSGVAQYQSIYGNGVYPDIYDKAGLFAREYLGPECADLTVVDGFLNTSKKSLIHIDNAATDLLVQYDGTIDFSLIRPGRKWLLTLGEFSIPKTRDKFHIVYTDPAQTEELTSLMRLHGATRSMLRYALVRIADFDFSADLAGRENAWPVVEVAHTGKTATIDYALPLSGDYDVSLDAAAGAAGEYTVAAMDENGKRAAAATFKAGQAARIRVPQRLQAKRLVISRTGGGELPAARLRVLPGGSGQNAAAPSR